ncbi:MAG TPA: hypothetical protein PKA63_08715 [Oligoflexia bacterium]|nr:hypothetical protein [Oligoflexia bacterium]HMP48732.1 hypothetical protein [Oligoflexia bacterium]
MSFVPRVINNEKSSVLHYGLRAFFSFFVILCFFPLLSGYKYALSEEGNSSVIESNSSGGQSPSPVESLKVSDDSGEEVLPLDAWVIKKRKIISPTPNPPQSNDPDETSTNDKGREEASGEGRSAELIFDEEEEPDDIKALFQEEKRAYSVLLEEQKGNASIRGKKEIPSVNRIFTKSVLSKEEQRRIEKALKIQRKVISEQRRQFSHLISGTRKKPQTARICLVAPDIMGLPSDVQRFADSGSQGITRLWRQIIKEITISECSLFVMTGLVSRTRSGRGEFVNRTTGLLNKVTGETWKYRISNAEGVGFFSLWYRESIFELFEFQELTSIALRRGGVFEEQSPLSYPLEIAIKDVRVSKPRTLRMIAFDLRNFSKIGSSPSTPYLMQMASVFNELAKSRLKSNREDLLLLSGSLKVGRSNPAWPILSGQLELRDFLSERACSLVEKEKTPIKARLPEKIEKGKGGKSVQVDKEPAPEYECKKDIDHRKARLLFGTISDFYTIPSYLSRKDQRKLALARENLVSDIFSVHELFSDKIGLTVLPDGKLVKNQLQSLSDFRSMENSGNKAEFIMIEVQTETHY